MSLVILWLLRAKVLQKHSATSRMLETNNGETKMITIRLKQKFDTKEEALHTLLCYVDREYDDHFELIGTETKGGKFDSQKQYDEALKSLGFKTI